MFKKFLNGLVFGFGFAVATIATVLFYINFNSFSSETNFSEESLVVTTPPSIDKSQEEFLGSLNTYSEGFLGKNNGVLVSGEGIITGSVFAEGRGIAGISLRLALNGEAYSQWGLTNGSGVYSISVPYGSYEIDGFEINRVSANRNLSGLIDASRHSFSGSIFAVSENRKGVGLDFFYIKPIVKSESNVEYGLNDAVIIAWEPYPNVKKYQIQVWEKSNPHEYRGNNRLFTWSTQPKTDKTSINLKNFTSNLKSGSYYSFEVRAFDERGMQVSKSADQHVGYDFYIK